MQLKLNYPMEKVSMSQLIRAMGSSSKKWILTVSLLLLLYCLFTIFYSYFGTINEDEGWYLYASKLVYEGKLPYLDFSYTQTPLLPFVYGLPQWCFGTSLYIGRITSVLFGIVTLLIAIITANRLQGKVAGAICAA